MTSLDSATYVVPDHGFGVIHNLPIADVSPEIFSDLLESAAAEDGYLSAELGPRTAEEGFAIRIGDSLVGHLSSADSQAYALFDWILSAGLHPRATAHVSMTDAAGEEWPTLNLLLPAPHLCIPANNPPAQRWTMLPGETTATLTEFSKDVTAFPHTDEHYLVSLRTRGFLRRNTVDVYINSTFLGSLPRDAAREIAPTVLDCTKTGRLAIAHGYFHYNADDRPALTIYAHNAANKHHAGLVLGVVAGGTAIMSAATAARAQAASAVPGGPAAGASTAGTSAASGFSVASAAGAAGASGAVTSNLLAAAGVAVLVGGGATVATNLLSEDEALSDTNTHSTAPAPEDNRSSLDSSHFDGNGPKRPAHLATPRIHDAGPTSGTSAQPSLADAPSFPAPHHHTYPSQTTKKPSATHSPHADRAQAAASDNRRGHHSEPRGGHHGDSSDAISRAASTAAAAASAAADNVDSARTSAPAPVPATPQTTSAATPSSSSAPAPQIAAKAPTATSSSSQSAEPSQTTESTKSTTSAEPSSEASSPAEPSDLPTSSTSTSEKTTSKKTTAETTTAASTEKQTAEPSSSATSSATSEPTSEPTQAADPSTPTSALESSEPQSSESTAPTTTSTLLTSESEPEPAPDTTIPGSELEPTPEPETTAPTTTIPGSELEPTPKPEPEITVEPEPALPTTDRGAPDEPEVPLVPLEPEEPQQSEEPGRPEEPEEPTTPPKVIVIVAEN